MLDRIARAAIGFERVHKVRPSGAVIALLVSDADARWAASEHSCPLLPKESPHRETMHLCCLFN